MISADELSIRKLTAKECCNLMDFNKGAYEKMDDVLSQSRIYMAAGNSIVVNCLVAIFGQMIDGHEDDYETMGLEASL